MKLIHYTTGLFFKTFLAVLIPASVILFFAMRLLVREEMDDNLRLTKIPVEESISEIISVGNHTDLLGDRILIQSVHRVGSESFRDTLMEMPEEADLEPFRMYEFYHAVDDKIYRVQICRKQLETKDLAIQIGAWVLLTPAVFLFLAFLWIRRRSRLLWSPFFHTLKSIRTFSLTTGNSLKPVVTSVDEFGELMATIQTMQEAMIRDYQNVRQFTGNASHEIQTPISVILNKIELISQKLTDNDVVDQLETIRAAAHRLSRLNQSLLMLSKLDNRQYAELEEIRVDKILQDRIEAISPVIHDKGLQVETQIEHCIVQAHPTLVESVISNLLMNAVRHNVPSGSILVSLTAGHLEFQNTGEPLTRSTDELKQRFMKDNPASKSTGLGLAIVTEICSVYDWTFTYEASDRTHITRISFST